jgi:hypothetical protein
MIFEAAPCESSSLSSSESTVSADIETSEASSSSSSFIGDILGGKSDTDGSSELPDAGRIGGARDMDVSGVEVPVLSVSSTLPSVVGMVEG